MPLTIESTNTGREDKHFRETLEDAKNPSEIGLDLTPGCASLDVWESLLVRACKSKSVSLYKMKRILGWRCALSVEHVDEVWIAAQLVEIIEKFGLKKMSDLIPMMHPSQKWKYGCDTGDCEDGFTAAVIAAACAVLRLTEWRKLPGYRRPSRSHRLLSDE